MHMAIIEAWCEKATQFATSFAAEAFGRAHENDDISTLRDALVIPATHGEVELLGKIELWSDAGAITFAPKRLLPKAFLRGFLTGVIRSAAGLLDDAPFSVTVITPETTERRRFAGLSPSGARRYLSTLIDDLVHTPHHYLWPCEAVFERWQHPERPIVEIHHKYRSGLASCSSSYGPVERLHNVPAPDEPLVDRIQRDRFDLFLRSEVIS
jgi:hypothetical protein